MSFIEITDEYGNQMIIALKRLDKSQLSQLRNGLTQITLKPHNKGDPEEYVYSLTPVEEIWEQIKLRL